MPSHQPGRSRPTVPARPGSRVLARSSAAGRVPGCRRDRLSGCSLSDQPRRRPAGTAATHALTTGSCRAAPRARPTAGVAYRPDGVRGTRRRGPLATAARGTGTRPAPRSAAPDPELNERAAGGPLVSVRAGGSAGQAGDGFGSGTGWAGPTMTGVPCRSCFGGRSMNIFSNSSESTVSSATSFSARATSLSLWVVRTSMARS